MNTTINKALAGFVVTLLSYLVAKFGLSGFFTPDLMSALEAFLTALFGGFLVWLIPNKQPEA